MRRIIGIFTGALVVGRLAAGAGDTPKERFAEAVSRAKANLATVAGQEYDRSLSRHFEQANGPVMQTCFQTTKEPDTTPFEMVFRLAKSGTAKDVLVWPETNISRCFRDALKAETFPVPSADGYLAYMEMRFAP